MYKINVFLLFCFVFVVISKTTFWENVTMGREGMLYMEDTLVEIWRNMYMGGEGESRKKMPETLQLHIYAWFLQNVRSATYRTEEFQKKQRSLTGMKATESSDLITIPLNKSHQNIIIHHFALNILFSEYMQSRTVLAVTISSSLRRDNNRYLVSSLCGGGDQEVTWQRGHIYWAELNIVTQHFGEEAGRRCDSSLQDRSLKDPGEEKSFKLDLEKGKDLQNALTWQANGGITADDKGGSLCIFPKWLSSRNGFNPKVVGAQQLVYNWQRSPRRQHAQRLWFQTAWWNAITWNGVWPGQLLLISLLLQKVSREPWWLWVVRTSVLHLSEKPAEPQPEISGSQENSLFLHRSANSTSEPNGEGRARGPSGSCRRERNHSPNA